MEGAGMVELGSRRRELPAPPRVVWRSLTDPHQPGARPWLDLRDDEVAPRVLEAREPTLVVWSSLWPDRRHERIRFDLAPEEPGSGCLLRWTLTSTDPQPPTASKLGHMRYRINLLINGHLRRSYGQ